MAIDIKQMAKLAGITENELKGLTPKGQIKLISKKMNAEQEKIELDEAKFFISNYEKQIPKLKSSLEQPIEIYVKAIGQKKSPTPVSIVGYNALVMELIVYYNDKLYSIKDSDSVKSIDELMNLLNTKKTKAPAKKKNK